MDRVIAFLRDNPIGVTAVVTAGIDLVVAFGINVSPDVRNGILGLVSAAGLAVARQSVTPNHKVRALKRAR